MEPGQARQILETLANGVDPSTGEVLAERSPFNDLQVIRALFYAVRELEKLQKAARPRSQLANAGKPWAKEEDASLVEAFDAGTPINELAERHRRTKGAIQSRLMRHGRLQAEVAGA
jgi:hypothetical protein